MNIIRTIKGFSGTALVAVALLFGSAANADPVTQLIHFDDANNGWKWYSDADRNFLLDPTNLQSSTLCADSTDGGNGSCVIESGQTVVTTMTRPENGTTLQGHANKDPDNSGADLLFTLDSFYFLLTGNGTGAENAITVEGSNLASFTLMLGGTYAGPQATNPVVTFYEGPNAGDPAGALVKNTGYIATFGDLFEDVDWIKFTAPDSAQLRLDCIVNSFDGATTQPASSFDGRCGGSTTQVPAPGGLALFGCGLLVLGLSRRLRQIRRKV